MWYLEIFFYLNINFVKYSSNVLIIAQILGNVLFRSNFKLNYIEHFSIFFFEFILNLFEKWKLNYTIQNAIWWICYRFCKFLFWRSTYINYGIAESSNYCFKPLWSFFCQKFPTAAFNHISFLPTFSLNATYVHKSNSWSSAWLPAKDFVKVTFPAEANSQQPRWISWEIIVNGQKKVKSRNHGFDEIL